MTACSGRGTQFQQLKLGDSRHRREIAPEWHGLVDKGLASFGWQVAVRSLAELALDVLPGAFKRCLGVDVRDEQERAVLTTELTFEARVLASG